MGHETAAEFGVSPLKYGFVCDIFGHVANLPQILNGFGIKGALVGRGTNDHTTPCHFRWKSPDGSMVTTFKVPETVGYGSFWYEVIREFESGALKDDKFTLIERAKSYVEREKGRSALPLIILMDGMDHTGIHTLATYICDELEKQYVCRVSPCNIETAVAFLERRELPERTGELNELAKAHAEHNMLITHTLSSRYDIKRENDICQTKLEKYASPCLALSQLRKFGLRKSFLKRAYKYLLQNHAHDSICGCSLGDVHKDMHYRFRQVHSISDEITLDFLHKSTALEKGDGCVLSVYNPLPFNIKRTLFAEINLPTNYSERWDPLIKYDQRSKFKLFDGAGREIQYTLMRVERDKYAKCLKGSVQKADVHNTVFTCELLPSGFTYIDI